MYTASVDGAVVYVGYGKIGRHKHCNSGKSHVYHLNRVHHTLGASAIHVCIKGYFSDKDEAKNVETELIKSLKPSFNVSETAQNKNPVSWAEEISSELQNLTNKEVQGT